MRDENIDPTQLQPIERILTYLLKAIEELRFRLLLNSGSKVWTTEELTKYRKLGDESLRWWVSLSKKETLILKLTGITHFLDMVDQEEDFGLANNTMPEK